jgi:hypothetical protein
VPRKSTQQLNAEIERVMRLSAAQRDDVRRLLMDYVAELVSERDRLIRSEPLEVAKQA